MASVIIPLGVAGVWLGLPALLRFLFIPPYQVKIVNQSPHTLEDVELHGTRGESISVGNIAPGVVRTYQPEFGEDSIHLTHRIGDKRFESRHYYFPWEMVFEFSFTETGYARVRTTFYSPFDDSMSYADSATYVCAVENRSVDDIEEFLLTDRFGIPLDSIGFIRKGESSYKAVWLDGQSKFRPQYKSARNAFEGELVSAPPKDGAVCLITWVIEKDGQITTPKIYYDEY